MTPCVRAIELCICHYLLFDPDYVKIFSAITYFTWCRVAEDVFLRMRNEKYLSGLRIHLSIFFA